jgi:hypothetical protein
MPSYDVLWTIGITIDADNPRAAVEACTCTDANSGYICTEVSVICNDTELVLSGAEAEITDINLDEFIDVDDLPANVIQFPGSNRLN